MSVKLTTAPRHSLPLPQDRLRPRAQVLAARQRELQGGDVVEVEVPALRDLLDEPAQGLVRDDGVGGPAPHRPRGQVQQLLAGRVDQDDLRSGVRHQHPVGQRLDDGADAALLGVEVVERPELFLLVQLRLARQADGLRSAVDDEPQLVGLERLRDEVVGPALHRLDGGLDRGIAGDDDDQDAPVELLDELQDLHPVAAGHFQVQQHQVRPPGLDHLFGLAAAAGFQHTEAEPLQDALGPIADVHLVVGHQDRQLTARRVHVPLRCERVAPPCAPHAGPASGRSTPPPDSGVCPSPASGSPTGRSIAKLAPCPGWLVTLIRPRWFSTMP